MNSNPIATKVIAAMQRRPLVRAALLIALKEAGSREALVAGLTPAHAAYADAANQSSVIVEHLVPLKAMAQFVAMISRAEDLYMPSGPPMSPLTTSYFTSWIVFDAYLGARRETIGTILLEFGAAFGIDPELLRLIRLMQESRMGIYVHKGVENDCAILEVLITGEVRRCIVPARLRWQAG